MPECYEYHMYKNNKLIRKISLQANTRDFIVIDDEAIEDFLTGKITWQNLFQLNFPNKILARTAFLGRLVLCAYEEGGNNDMEYEKRIKMANKSLSSILGQD